MKGYGYSDFCPVYFKQKTGKLSLEVFSQAVMTSSKSFLTFNQQLKTKSRFFNFVFLNKSAETKRKIFCFYMPLADMV